MNAARIIPLKTDATTRRLSANDKYQQLWYIVQNWEDDGPPLLILAESLMFDVKDSEILATYRDGERIDTP